MVHTAQSLDQSPRLTPETFIAVDERKAAQLRRDGYWPQIIDFIGRHFEGDPGDGFPAMTNALNKAMPERSFVSCFLLVPMGERVTLHSFLHPDGTIERLVIKLPPR